MTQEENARNEVAGCVLRNGGPLNGTIIRGRRPVFVAIEYEDGSHDLYRTSGNRDIEHSELERYDYEQLL